LSLVSSVKPNSFVWFTGWIWWPSTAGWKFPFGDRFRLKMIRTVFAAFNFSLSSLP
jgi:hypothetical protein